MIKTLSLLIASVVAAPLVASAAAVTYDFTGVTTSNGSGSFSSVATGTVVTGTYTFNIDPTLGNANPYETFGTVGSTTSQGWQIYNAGGSGINGYPNIPGGLVFSDTVNVAGSGTTYRTAPLGTGTYATSSGVDGYSPLQGLYQFQAQEASNTDAQNQTLSSLTLSDTTAAYGSNGLPIFNPSTSFYTGGVVQTTVNGNVSALGYSITSMTTPVPLPAAAWLTLSCLGGFGAFVRRRPAGSLSRGAA